MSLYNKENAGEDVDDVWDDTELIRMYEESISTTYNKLKVPKENIEKKSFTTEEGVTYEWKVGAKCMAPFIEEGEVFWYPATISWIAGGENRDVGVTFDGYGNTENVDIKDIWEESEAMDAEESATPNPKSHGPSKRSTPKIPCIAPPPPPGALNFAPPEESEALSSMLMSWYMSGYHTGYYQALADQKAKRGSSTRN